MYDEFGRIDDQAWAAVANHKEHEAFQEGLCWGFGLAVAIAVVIWFCNKH